MEDVEICELRISDFNLGYLDLPVLKIQNPAFWFLVHTSYISYPSTFKCNNLSDRGIKEATEAGKVLKENGFDFRLANTSYLKRAIKTLNRVIEEVDLMWIQVEKSWCLYGKHCGNLQELNKEETAENNALPPDSVFVNSITLRFKSGIIIVTESIPGNPAVWVTIKIPFMSVNPQPKPYPAKCEL